MSSEHTTPRFTGLGRLALVWLAFASSAFAGKVWLSTPAGDLGTTIVIVGDTVQLDIWVDTEGEDISGYQFFFTLDPAYLVPVLKPDPDNSNLYQPFVEGTFIDRDPSINNLHPTVNPDHPADTVIAGIHIERNEIFGIQLDYVQLTGSVGGTRTTVIGTGLAASFFVRVINVPPDTSRRIPVQFDNISVHSRETRYYLPNDDKDFGSETGIDLRVAGVNIAPPIANRTIAPGSGLTVWLGGHFATGLAAIDSTDATWSIIADLNPSAPFSATVTPSLGSYRLDLTTGANDQDSLYVVLEVSATDTAGFPTYTDQQEWKVIVDHVPVFNGTLPDFTFDEDTAPVFAGDSVFTDQDDNAGQMQIRLEPDSLVHMAFSGADSSFTFSADTNWYGIRQALLIIRDSMGEQIDTTVALTVNPVNDAPIVNMDNFGGALRDTLIMHRSAPATVDLAANTTDVDDVTLVWSTDDPSPANLTVGTPTAAGFLNLAIPDTAVFTDFRLIITATDTSGASSSDTLVIAIRSWPPDITEPLSDILVVASGPDTVALAGLAVDNDTPDADLRWSFEVRDYILDSLDTQISWTYDSTAQEIILTAPPGYDAQDRLDFFVVDDNSNRDTASARLGVFSTLKPAVFTFPLDTLIWNTVTDLYDLDDFIQDPIYSPNQLDTINWTYTGGTRLTSVSIDAGHIVTITTDASFFGWDTVTFIATNPGGLSDTSDQVLRILPDVDLPPVWLPLGNYEVVFTDTTDLFRLTDRVIDDFTLADSLTFGWVTNPDPLKPVNLLVDSTTWDMKVTDQTANNYTTWLYFTATDEQNQVGVSDTVFISIQASYSPVWSTIPIIRMETSSQARDSLWQYLSDRDNPDKTTITITVTPADTRISASYDPVTSIVTYTSRSIQAETLVLYSASDGQNVSSTLARVIVKEPFDPVPPEGVLSYYFHPVHNRRIEYVVVADSTTVNLTSTYVLNSRLRGLTFTQTDALPPTYTWIGRDSLSVAGSYQLFADVNDQRNNVNRMSLDLTIGFSKAIGGRLVSPDGNLTLSYPPLPIPKGNLIVIRQTSADGGQAGGLPPLAKEAPLRTYDIDTNLPEEILMTVDYRMNGSDPYHAFYDLTDGAPQRLETYLTDEDRFEAYVPTGRTVAFAKSAVRAGVRPSDGQLWTHPNPFNATLQVRFMLRVPGTGRIAIYNLLGQLVFRTPRSHYSAGIHSVAWHGNDLHGRTLPSGIYFVRLTTSAGAAQLQKVTLLK